MESTKGIGVGDQVHVYGKYFMNQHKIQATKIEPGPFFTFGRIVLILLILGSASAGYYYRSTLVKVLRKFQDASKALAQKSRQQVPVQATTQVHVPPVTSPSYIFTSPVGAAIAAICFFLPWAKFSCGGMHDTASGADLGGILWIVFIAAVASLGAFFYFRSQSQTENAKPIILWSSLGALAILVIRYIMFMSGEKTEYGTIRPKDIGFSIQFGAIGTLIGFVVAIFGIRFLSRMNLPNQKVPSRTEENPMSQPK